MLEAQGFTQAIAAITLPNEASVGSTKRLGFARAGTYEQVGFKFGEWRERRPVAARARAALAHPAEPRPVSAAWRG